MGSRFPVRDNLFLSLVFLLSSWRCTTYSCVEGVMTVEPPCFFPGFLQETCSKPSKNCRYWLQGRQREYEGSNAFYGNAITERREEFSWIVKREKIRIFANGLPSSRSNPQEFYCWKKLAPHVFIILSKIKNAANKSDTGVKYSCLKFRKRGRNVIEYQQSLWMDNSSSLACKSLNLITNQNPLILTDMQELPDCPAELNGGFQIMQLHNGKTEERCVFNSDTDRAIFESDCLGKEGLTVQVPLQRSCPLKIQESAVATGLGRLRFLCYSAPWKDEQFIYFIVKRQKFARKGFLHGEESDFLCARFQKVEKEIDGEIIQVQFFNQPTCWRNLSAASIFLSIQIRRRVSLDQPARAPSEINETECSFPQKIQGVWRETSQQNGPQKVVINRTMVDISPYGRFHCKQRHFFQYQAPYKCSSLVIEKWPGTGRVRFDVNDYLLLSNFSNGCRSRITRFGVTEVIGNDALTYRLSQSVPVESNGQNSKSYYHILEQFCSSWLPYIKDPHPIWGRNIEKIVMKDPVRSKKPCLLPAFGKGVYYFKWMNADQDECNGVASRVRFGCDSSLTFEVKYDSGCGRPDVSFTCVGKAGKTGVFSLLQDVKTKRISCAFFDKENNNILRLNSTQCSDIDWGKRPWEPRNFAEKFVLQYYDKCPIKPDTTDYPAVIRRRNASQNFPTFSAVIIWTCFSMTKIFCSITLP